MHAEDERVMPPGARPSTTASVRLSQSITKEEEEARKEFMRTAAEFTRFVAADREEGTFVVPVESAFTLFARPDRTEFTVLKRVDQTLADHGVSLAGGTIVDVGANLGTTTIAALTRHGFARGVAIEPNPENVRLTTASIALNGFRDRVTVVEAAVSSESGTASFAHRKLTNDSSKGEPIQVKTVTLDELVTSGVIDAADVTLLWLDVMGHEGPALARASSLLARRVPVVFALRPGKMADPERLFDSLGAHYDTLVDLRYPESDGEWSAVLEPITALADFGERQVTDLLVFRRL